MIKPILRQFATAAILLGTASVAFAQANPTEEIKNPGFKEIVLDGGFVNNFIWFLLFAVSIATMAFIIDAVILLKREKFIPPTLVDGVKESLDAGNLEDAIAYCEEHPSPLSRMLLAGFANISEGFDTIQDSISAAGDMENERVLQRINFMNLCGQMGPMLGLLGTVTGMVAAFNSLATATGSSKARLLATSIAIALWTTIVGLLISIPALLGYTFAKNTAVKIILEMQSTVMDLIKGLKNAEVDSNEQA